MSKDKSSILEKLEQLHKTSKDPVEFYNLKSAYFAEILEENEDILYGLFWDEYNQYLIVPKSQRGSTTSWFISIFDGIIQKTTRRAVRFAGALLLDPLYPVRDFVAEALGRMKSLDAYNYLVAVVYDEDYQISSRAVRALGEIGALEAEPLLVNIMNGDDPLRPIDDMGDVVQLYALEGLRSLDTPTAWDEIESVASRSGFDEEIRTIAIGYLSSKKGNAVLSFLQRLTDDENHKVQRSAAYYLRQLQQDSTSSSSV